jgi:hypothetical protein
VYFVPYRDKKVVGVFVRFRAPLHLSLQTDYLAVTPDEI